MLIRVCFSRRLQFGLNAYISKLHSGITREDAFEGWLNWPKTSQEGHSCRGYDIFKSYIDKFLMDSEGEGEDHTLRRESAPRFT
jgi:hypothetical protein